MLFVLVHGSWHDGSCWDAVAAELRDGGHHVVAPDLPTDDPTVSWEGLADAVEAALDGYDEPPVLVGHSSGALTVALVASRRPTRMTVYLTPAIPVPEPPERAPPVMRGPVDTGHIDIQGRKYWEPDDAVSVMYRQVDRATAIAAATRLRPNAAHGQFPLSGPPDVPTACILASDDEFYFRDGHRWCAVNVFGVLPIEISGGHFPMLERPAELAALLCALVAN